MNLSTPFLELLFRGIALIMFIVAWPIFRGNELGRGTASATEPPIQDSWSVYTLAATQAAIVACECTGPKSLSGQLVPPARLYPGVKSWPKIFVREI